MTHETPNPHDAEEQLRPFLGALFEAQQKINFGRTSAVVDEGRREERVAYDRALGKALQLLGVRR